MTPRIIITMGEPAGIGPELIVKIAQNEYRAQLIILGCPTHLKCIAEQLNLPLSLTNMQWSDKPSSHRQGHLWVEPLEYVDEIKVGQPSADNASQTLQSLRRASELAITEQVAGVVTAPVHKAVLNQVDPTFLGHTEFFAEQAGIARVVMMLATNQLRMTLATTHIPLNKVSDAITQNLLSETLGIIDKSFYSILSRKAKIAVCGLNPHAGENGLLGKEEIEVIAPCIQDLVREGLDVHGPFPADSLFTENKRKQYDVFLAMYHDQGLPVIKALGFGECANITLGLPYIRTSVDHGTALDIADQFCASPDSLNFAINYAIQLAKGQLPL